MYTRPTISALSRQRSGNGGPSGQMNTPALHIHQDHVDWRSQCSTICVDRINSLWPADTIWWHRYGSTLARVMACCLTTPSNYRISSVKSSDIHLRAISQEIPQQSITKIGLKTAYLKFNSNLPGANGLTSSVAGLWLPRSQWNPAGNHRQYLDIIKTHFAAPNFPNNHIAHTLALKHLAIFFQK